MLCLFPTCLVLRFFFLSSHTCFLTLFGNPPFGCATSDPRHTWLQAIEVMDDAKNLDNGLEFSLDDLVGDLSDEDFEKLLNDANDNVGEGESNASLDGLLSEYMGLEDGAVESEPKTIDSEGDYPTDSSMVVSSDDDSMPMTEEEEEDDDLVDPVLAELQTVLPGMPTSRLERLRRAFARSLNYPSLLVLTPLLRENMPEEITPAWLRNTNLQNAHYCVQKAVEDDALDLHMMNGMLQVTAASGGIDRALLLYDHQFQQYGLVRTFSSRDKMRTSCCLTQLVGAQVPNAYSNRLILQMLIKNNRLSRALQLKTKMEETTSNDGVVSVVDALTYGSFVDYYSRHGRLGSALLMLNECVVRHGAPPNEKSLSRLRQLCRRHNDHAATERLTALAGNDPLAWLQEGEGRLKRERSKKGNRDILRAKNRALQI